MCCFTEAIESVSNTSIFVRNAGDGKQHLAYSMKLHSLKDVAMILPLPTPKGSPANAVAWIDLSEFPHFFDVLYREFAPSIQKGGDDLGDLDGAPLAVASVGNFEASFVPAVKDFGRLDPRFRMPEGVWERLPAYRDFGFAVFKLKKGNAAVHPMAFTFPRADPHKLFFPTVHVHDGAVHPTAKFDHALYLQSANRERLVSMMHEWKESPNTARQIQMMDVWKTHGLVSGDLHVYHREIRGMQKNEDLYL
jgi:hypothetical protein